MPEENIPLGKRKEITMPWIIDTKTCSLCGQKHTLVFDDTPDFNLLKPEKYRYICPNTNTEATLVIGSPVASEEIDSTPEDAVRVTPC